MAAVVLLQRGLRPLHGLGLIVATALVVAGALWTVGSQSNFQLQRELQRALAAARETASPTGGQAALVWFSREDCSRCAAFRTEILPAIQADYGARLGVSELQADPGIPAPTVVILGRRETLLYPNPSLDSLRHVIDEELGK